MPRKPIMTPEERAASRKASKARTYQRSKAKKLAEAARISGQQVAPIPKDVIDATSDWKAKTWTEQEMAEYAHSSRLIRLCWSPDDRIEEKPYLLAGYLNLPSTAELKKLIYDEKSIETCRSWMQAVEDNYGIAKDVMILPKAVSKKAFFEFIADKSIETVLIEHAMNKRILSNTPEKQYAVFAYYVSLLLDAFPQVFCGSLHSPDKNPLTFHGHNAEDWGRGAFWLLYITRHVSKSFTVVKSYVWKPNGDSQVDGLAMEAADSAKCKKLGVLDCLTNSEVQAKLLDEDRCSKPIVKAATPVYWGQVNLDYNADSDESEWQGFED